MSKACNISKMYDELTQLLKDTRKALGKSGITTKEVALEAIVKLSDGSTLVKVWANGLKDSKDKDYIVEHMKIPAIISKLQNVDVSKIVSDMKPWDAGKAGNVWGQRVSDKQSKSMNDYTNIENFGNPFLTKDVGNVKLESVTATADNSMATAQYYNWLTNNEVPYNYTGDKTQLKIRRDWILNNLDKINNATRIMYKGTVAGKQINHVTALIKIAEDKLGKPITKSSNKSSNTPEFDKLPSYTEGQHNMTYAGIGSRETPAEVLQAMTEVAKELSNTYKLQTGATFKGKEEGADKAFSDGTTNKELFQPENATDLTRSIASEIHPNMQSMKTAVFNKSKRKGRTDSQAQYAADGAENLQARNTFQIFGRGLDTPVDFVLFYAKETSNPMRPAGGTGQAVEMARRKGIPTINMADSNWRKQLDAIVGKPVEDGVVVADKNWTRASAKADSNNVYIFGDNTADKRSKYVPKSTQAVVRDLPNAFGIDTKKSRTEQFTEADYDKYVKYLDRVFKALDAMKAKGTTFVVSKNGIGTGKADLPAKLHNEMAKRFNAFVGQDLVAYKDSIDSATISSTIAGNKVEYTAVPRDKTNNLAGTTSKGIRIQEGLTAKDIVDYLTTTAAPNEKLNGILADKAEATRQINAEYGVDFHELLGAMDTKTANEFLLLHERRHQIQANKRSTWKQFTTDYKADPVKFEKDANVWALKQLNLIPVKGDAVQDFVEEIDHTTKQPPVADGTLQPEQQKAADKISRMLNSTKDNIFILEGEGGTGKSYTIGKTIAASTGVNVVIGAATAHSAKDVISDFMEESIDEAHKGIDVVRKVAVQLPGEISVIQKGTVIVLDEISMISNSTMGRILDAVKYRKGEVKLILLGDRAQLRPVVIQDSYKIYGNSIYVDGAKVEGYTSGNTFITEDAEYPIIIKGNDRLADNTNNKLKANIFRIADSSSSDISHTLTAQQRQKDIELYTAIRTLRTEVLEDTAEAENDSKYTEQLARGLNAVFSHKSVNSISTVKGITNFINQHNMVEELRNGKSVILAANNKAVNNANTLLAEEFAKRADKTAEYNKFGSFSGQVLRASANVTIGDAKVTNNSNIKITQLSSLKDGIAAGAVNVYKGDVIVDAAIAASGIAPEEAITKAELDTVNMPDNIKNIIPVMTFIFNKVKMKIPVFNPVVISKLAQLNETPATIANKYGIISVGSSKTPNVYKEVYIDSISSKDARGNLTKEMVDSLEPMFDNFKPVYAMTIHKSQGRSFDSIFINLDMNNNLTKVNQLELAYVGLTRSKGPIQILSGYNSASNLVQAMNGRPESVDTAKGVLYNVETLEDIPLTSDISDTSEYADIMPEYEDPFAYMDINSIDTGSMEGVEPTSDFDPTSCK